jgi:plasmid stability protein
MSGKIKCLPYTSRNVPKDLCESLRDRARGRHRSIAAEVVALLEENIPTAKELRARRAFLRKLEQIRAQNVDVSVALKSSEELIREER